MILSTGESVYIRTQGARIFGLRAQGVTPEKREERRAESARKRSEHEHQ